MDDYQINQLLDSQLLIDNHNNSLSDHEIAKALQEQFNQEQSLDNPGNLVYAPKKPDLNQKNNNNSRSLVDPSWELVDPTPNIHNLFVAFDRQFFWTKLQSVCVSWSKRMYSCAGICSYHGRGGLCSITLSEPLLKLRPRKDLVETLLHEMIHAYLFLTDRDRDRDGHGPKFHEHMYRINKQAGTNITVYHTFHDEVKLYKTHWWKCDGPCQHKHPFYGIVRRSMNRAPGKNDRWWNDHMRTCGGTFLKVKEPEKKKSTRKSENKENARPKQQNAPDIRNYFPSITQNKAVQPKLTDKTDIDNRNASQSTQSDTLAMTKNELVLFNGKGNVLSGNAIKRKLENKSDSYADVRNHWANRFPSVKRIKMSSHINDDDECLNTASSSINNDQKVPVYLNECDICMELISANEFDAHRETCLRDSSVRIDTTSRRQCPLCSETLNEHLYDLHAAECVLKGFEDLIENIDETVSRFNGNEKSEQFDDEKVPCLICRKFICKQLLNDHLERCVSDEIFVDESLRNEFSVDHNKDDLVLDFIQKDQSNKSRAEIFVISDDDDDDGVVENTTAHNLVTCPVCTIEIAEDMINSHLDSCLS